MASNGNPYIHTIYDAFKVDANGYDVVLKDVNKNWLDASFDWSYLEETSKSTKAAMDNFWKELNALPNNTELDSKEHHGVNTMIWLLSEGTKQGTYNLTNRILKTTYNPNISEEQVGKQAKATTDYALKVLTKMGFKPETGKVTAEQYKWFVKFMESRVYDIHRHNARITEKTNQQKGRLRQKITGSGQKVYQYYSH